MKNLVILQIWMVIDYMRLSLMDTIHGKKQFGGFRLLEYR